LTQILVQECARKKFQAKEIFVPKKDSVCKRTAALCRTKRETIPNVQRSPTNVDELIAAWFSWLPVSEDPEEAAHIYGYMCDLIEGNHPVILGANNCNLPRIVSIIAEAFCTKVIEAQSATGTRMLTIVKQVESNPDVMAACASTLSPEQQQALQDAYRELANVATA